MSNDAEQIALEALQQVGLTFEWGRENTNLEITANAEQIQRIENAFKGMGWKSSLVNRENYTRNGNTLCVHDDCINFLLDHGIVNAPPVHEEKVPPEGVLKNAKAALCETNLNWSRQDDAVIIKGTHEQLERITQAFEDMGWKQGLFTKKDYSTRGGVPLHPNRLTAVIIYENRIGFLVENGIIEPLAKIEKQNQVG